MNLTEWAHPQGIHVTTAYRWYREGTRPVPARKAGRLILVSPVRPPAPHRRRGRLVRAGSSHDQKADLDPPGRPPVGVVVVEHCDRLGSMNTELVEAALAAHGHRLVMVDDSEVTGDLVRDMIEVLTSFCGRPYGRRPARNRALEALGGRVRGYATAAERHAKAIRLQALQARLAGVDRRLEAGTVSVVRGGKALLRKRGSLTQAGMTAAWWRREWESARLFLTADGEKDKAWGNETIRWNPDEGWLEIKLPAPLGRLANRPHGRYRLSCPVGFSYRGDEVAAQAASGAVRYDISHDPSRGRWYIDATWKAPPAPPAPLDRLRQHPVLAVDLNHGHLAAWAVTPDGNPAGPPVTIPLDLAGLRSATRDGRLRAAISSLTRLARQLGCRAVVIEDLDFADARQQGRERAGSRPSRGRRGRGFRRQVSGFPAGKFRDRLVQMTSNAGLAVIVVDPAYTSRWGREHWLAPLQDHSHPMPASGHHAAAVVIGRRALGHRARRRAGVTGGGQRTSRRRATPRASVARQTTRNGRPREAQRQPPRWRKTATANRTRSPDQAIQDRSGPPATQDHVLLAQ